MRHIKSTYKRSLSILMSVAIIVTNLVAFSVYAAQVPSTENLALNKPVTASRAYATMPASYLTDADETSRWSTEVGPTQWAYVDLGESLLMDYFSMIWESAAERAADYNIYV